MENSENVWGVRLCVFLLVLLGAFGLMNIIYPLVVIRPVGGVIMGVAIYWGILGHIGGLFPWPPWSTSRR